jgi:adenine-specific DNA-methyltransferase
MNYIGSKNKLSPWIFEVIKEEVNKDLKDVIFADIFAGTGQVARYFKKHVKQVIVNDLEEYSFYLNSHYIGNTEDLEEPKINISPKSGIITKHFSPGSNFNRMYYTVENAKLIDGIRSEIEDLFEKEKISQKQYYWLMASLIECSDSVANTASVYGAYLKNFKRSAIKAINFKLVPYEKTNQNNIVLQGDANVNIKNISGDVLYLDPPYNARQYGANYHVLNKIVEYKDFTTDKKTGLDTYNKSVYCRKSLVAEAFEDLISNADFKYIFISYNNEGLLSEDELKKILEKYGTYKLREKRYQRFKSDSSRNNKSDHTFEHLHCLEKF